MWSKFSDTKNALTVEVGGYENVKVLRDIKVVDGDLVDALHQLPRGSVRGDCIQFGRLSYLQEIMLLYGH